MESKEKTNKSKLSISNLSENDKWELLKYLNKNILPIKINGIVYTLSNEEKQKIIDYLNTYFENLKKIETGNERLIKLENDKKDQKEIQKNQINELKNKLYETSETESLLLEWTIVTPHIWEANKKNGVKLILDKNTRQGYSENNIHNNARIELGTKQVPNEIKVKWWLNINFSDADMKRYIFSHENAHHIIFYIADHEEKFPYFRKLYESLKKIREKNHGIGLSQLGNMKIYDSEIRQTAHDEDFVDLLNRYCMNPSDFRSYLDYLTNTDTNILAKKGLYKLQPASADLIFKWVSESVATFLKENGLITQINI